MSARPTHDLSVKTGEFRGSDGQTKGRWLRIGTVFLSDDGKTSIKLECIPVGLEGWDGWVAVFPRAASTQENNSPQPSRQQQGRQQQNRPAGPPAGRGSHAQNDFDDDIPF